MNSKRKLAEKTADRIVALMTERHGIINVDVTYTPIFLHQM